MSVRLMDRLRGAASSDREESPFQRMKRELHAEVVATLDPKLLENTPRVDLEVQIRALLGELIRSRSMPLSREEQLRVVEDVIDEILGFGPIERLLHDNAVSDILINGPDTVYVERAGKLEKADVHFRDDRHLLHVIDRIVSAVGRRIDEAAPMVDARLPDGSRFNAIIPPLAIDGPTVSIRRFGVNPIRREDLVRLNSIPEPLMVLLEGCVKAKLNILVSGGTGSGKTTFLNVLSSFIPHNERIVSIEDAAELRLQQPHVVRLETRPPNLEGLGEVTTRDLVRNSLRMRPDRILVGEIRGVEAIDMLQAMNTGHEGSISTIHANSPRHALGRMETMVGLGMGNIPGPAIREMIAEAIDLVIQVARLSDGHRRITSITELAGMEGNVISTQEVFRFKQRTVDSDGAVRGNFEATGIRPAFTSRLQAHGIEIPGNILNFRAEV